jgi:hypothetical protein
MWISATAGAALMAAVLTLTACGGNHGGQTPASSVSSSAAASSSSAAAPPSGTAASTSATPGQDDQLALQTLDAIVRGDFNGATARFDPLLKEQLKPDGLATAWRTYQEQFGKYQSRGDPQDVARGDLTVVNVPLQMERMPGEFRVTFHPDTTVAGIYFLDAGVPVP